MGLIPKEVKKFHMFWRGSRSSWQVVEGRSEILQGFPEAGLLFSTTMSGSKQTWALELLNFCWFTVGGIFTSNLTVHLKIEPYSWKVIQNDFADWFRIEVTPTNRAFCKWKTNFLFLLYWDKNKKNKFPWYSYFCIAMMYVVLIFQKATIAGI